MCVCAGTPWIRVGDKGYGGGKVVFVVVAERVSVILYACNKGSFVSMAEDVNKTLKKKKKLNRIKKKKHG